MDSLDHPSFNMFSSRQTSNDPEDFNTLYPEPPHGLSSFSPMDLGLSPDAFGPYPRPGHENFPAAMAFDGSVLYADALYNMYGKMSPGTYAEDREMPVASPNRSTTSVPSAPSSAVGSPRSNHGHPAPLPDWVAAPHGLGVGPAIVGQGEYFMGTEYSFAVPGMEDFTNFDFTSTKPPGFVGELSRIPRSCVSRPQRSIFSSASCGPVSGTRGAAAEQSLAPDTQSVWMAATTVSSVSPVSSRKSSISGYPPAVSTQVSPVSSPSPSWASPTSVPGDMSPWAWARTSRMVSPFFCQGRGHFVPPLQSSCWFPLVNSEPAKV